MIEAIRSTGGLLSTQIRNMLGTYTPSDPTSMSGADWEYIVSAALLLMAFYFIFKLLTLLFKS